VRTVEPLEIPLTREALAAYKTLVPEKYRPLLEGTPPANYPANTLNTGFVEIEEGKPVGIAIGSNAPDLPFATIHHLTSPQPEELLAKMEEALDKKRLHLSYYEDHPQAKEIIECAVKRGWKGPVAYYTTYTFEEKKFYAPWFDRTYAYGKGYTSFPWNQLSKKEEEAILHYLKQGRFLKEMNPFIYRERVEWKCSFGLRYNGEVIGWIIAHRVKPDTIRYSALYIELEHRHKGEIIKLAMEAMRAQRKAGIAYGVIEVNHLQTSGNWLQFITKRAAPFAQMTEREMMLWLSR
jgi:hypothetical protein